MSFTEIVERESRLVALKMLAEQPDRRLNSSLMREALAEIGAVTLTEAGSVLIATLTERGLDHVERRIILDGVKRPSAPAGF